MFRDRPDFQNRREAGRRLGAALMYFRAGCPLILALPRGGVPVAFEVAQALDAELDLLFVRKLGAPGHKELGIGAIVDGTDPQIVLNEDVVRELRPTPEHIEKEMHRQLTEIERRREAYLGGTTPIPTAGRTMIVVDDGIATGGTVKAALLGLRKAHPARLVLAVPVAPPETLAALRRECDEILCLSQPHPFYAVGAHYAEFGQTGDAEVIRLLRDAHRSGQPTPSSLNHTASRKGL